MLPPESGVKWTKYSTIETDPYNFMTARKGVFAGGDCQLGAATIIEGVAQGKLAARAIDAYLRGEDMAEVSRRIEAEERKPDLFDIVPYKPVEPKVKMPMLPYEDRKRNFRLIELGYTQEQAERESGRCLQCACPAAGQCDLQKYSIEYNLENNRFHDGEPADYHDYEFDLSHSFILRDPNKCINCTQCVRVCHDVIGPNCYGMFGKGFDTIVSTPFNVSLDADGLRLVRRLRAGLPDRLADDGRARAGALGLRARPLHLLRRLRRGLPARRAGRDAELRAVVLQPLRRRTSTCRCRTWRARHRSWCASVCRAARRRSRRHAAAGAPAARAPHPRVTTPPAPPPLRRERGAEPPATEPFGGVVSVRSPQHRGNAIEQYYGLMHLRHCSCVTNVRLPMEKA